MNSSADRRFVDPKAQKKKREKNPMAATGGFDEKGAPVPLSCGNDVLFPSFPKFIQGAGNIHDQLSVHQTW